MYLVTCNIVTFLSIHMSFNYLTPFSIWLQMIFIYIVLYSHSNYTFYLNINTLYIKILYDLRGFTVQVTYICQKYLGFHTVSFENHHSGFWNYGRGFLHTWPIFEQWFCTVQFCKLPPISSERWVTERACSTAIVQYRAVSCIIAQNRSLLPKIRQK